MPETKAANPTSVTDASLDAAVAELAEQAAASAGGTDAAVIAASPLDAALAATADELSEFADAESVLGSPVAIPDATPDEQPSPSPRLETPSSGAAASEAMTANSIADAGSHAVEAGSPSAIAPSDTTPEAVSETPVADAAPATVLSAPLEPDDLSDFSDPVTVLSAISRDLESLAPPTSVEPLAESEGAVAASEPEAVDTPEPEPGEAEPPTLEDPAAHDKPAAAVVAAQPAEPAPAASVGPDSSPVASGEAIDQLDDVLASKAETVLEQTPEKPRVAEAAPTETATQPAATAAPATVAPAKPVPAASRPEPAESEPSIAATPRSSPTARLKPHLLRGLARVTEPLVALDSKLSHATRQTIAWVALFTIFNATAVWGIVLVRGPAKAPEPAGQTTPFYKPGDPIPHDGGHGGGHGASKKSDKGGHDDGHGAKKDDHGKSASKDKTKAKDGHAKAEKKSDKKKDSHAKADTKSKKKGKETAAAGHH